MVSKNENLIVNFNLFEKEWHVSTCDVEWCKIIWKPNYARRAKRRPPMQLPSPFRVKCFNDEKRSIENVKHLEIFKPSQYRSMLRDRGLWCLYWFTLSMSPCCQCILRFMLVLNDFVSGPTILARVQLILSWFLFLNGYVYAPTCFNKVQLILC
jgi:hypothetical protein